MPYYKANKIEKEQKVLEINQETKQVKNWKENLW